MKTLCDIVEKFKEIDSLLKSWIEVVNSSEDEEKIYVLDNQKVSVKFHDLEIEDKQHLYIVITSSRMRRYLADGNSRMIGVRRYDLQNREEALSDYFSCAVKVISEYNYIKITELVKDSKIAFDLSAVKSKDELLQKLQGLLGKDRQFADAPSSEYQLSFFEASSDKTASTVSTIDSKDEEIQRLKLENRELKEELGRLKNGSNNTKNIT